jgi:hypothetical protein
MPRIVDEAIDYLTEREPHIPPMIAVLALIGLGKTARLASLGLVTLWFANQIRNIDRHRGRRPRKDKQDQLVDTTEEDSFPASDAPGYSPTISGAPEEVSNVARLRTVH